LIYFYDTISRVSLDTGLGEARERRLGIVVLFGGFLIVVLLGGFWIVVLLVLLDNGESDGLNDWMDEW
jgi:hypothetical protein